MLNRNIYQLVNSALYCWQKATKSLIRTVCARSTKFIQLMLQVANVVCSYFENTTLLNKLFNHICTKSRRYFPHQEDKIDKRYTQSISDHLNVSSAFFNGVPLISADIHHVAPQRFRTPVGSPTVEPAGSRPYRDTSRMEHYLGSLLLDYSVTMTTTRF